MLSPYSPTLWLAIGFVGPDDLHRARFLVQWAVSEKSARLGRARGLLVAEPLRRDDLARLTPCTVAETPSSSWARRSGLVVYVRNLMLVVQGEATSCRTQEVGVAPTPGTDRRPDPEGRPGRSGPRWRS